MPITGEGIPVDLRPNSTIVNRCHMSAGCRYSRWDKIRESMAFENLVCIVNSRGQFTSATHQVIDNSHQNVRDYTENAAMANRIIVHPLYEFVVRVLCRWW